MCLAQGDTRVAERRARARTRWLLAYTLLNNPSLRAYRKDKDNGLGWHKARTPAQPQRSRSNGGKRGKGDAGDVDRPLLSEVSED